MNAWNIFWLCAALTAGLVFSAKVQEIIGVKKNPYVVDKVEERYLMCIDGAKDAGQCALNELMLRGLTCQK